MRSISRIRYCRPLIVAALALGVMPIGVHAAAPEDLNDDEKRKMKQIILIMEKAWESCKDNALKDTLAGSGDQMEYEKVAKDDDGVRNDDPTFGCAIKHLKDMVDNDKFKKKTPLGRGRTDVKRGVENDVILLNKRTVERLCADGTSGVDKVTTKMYLGATIANEMTHVYHEWIGGTNKKKCDAEKDSDCASIKFLEAIKNALEDDDNAGMPNDTVAKIDGDDQKVEGLKKCFDDAGVSSAADIAKVFQNVCNRLGKVKSSPTATDGKGYKGRKERFEAAISADPYVGWTFYSSARDAGENETSHAENIPARDGATMVGDDLISVRNFAVPNGLILIGSRSYRNALDQVMLAMISGDEFGARQLQIFRDDDDDDLPEIVPLAQLPLPPSAPGFPVLYEYTLLPGVPETLHPQQTNDGLMLHDKAPGAFLLLYTDPSGSPLGPPQFLFQDPGLQLFGGFDYLKDVREIFPGSTQFVFGGETHTPGDGTVIWFTVPNGGGPVGVTNDPGLFLAEALGQFNSVGADFVHLGQTQMVMFGEPFFSINLYSIGRGVQQFIAFGDTNETGESPPVGPFAPLGPNDLYMLDDDSGRRSFHLVPRIGEPIGHSDAEDNGDGFPDTVYLSADPPRLHFLAGSPSAPAVVREHLVEVALEPFVGLGGFATWNDVDGRTMIGPEVDVEIIALNLMSVEPIYIQSVHDFDNDLVADEAVLISLPTDGLQWQATMVDDISTTPVELIQQAKLPIGFEPDAIRFLDLGNDGFLDVQISDFNGGPDVCLINQGNGTDPLLRFQLGECVEPFCFGDADGSGSVDFGDITSVLGNWLNDYAPGTGLGDANGDGIVDFGDITEVLGNWLSGCS